MNIQGAQGAGFRSSQNTNSQAGPSRQETPSVPVSSVVEANLLMHLCRQEKQLCRDMGLAPNRYLKIQEELTTQIMRGNITKKSDAYSLFQLEPTKIDKVYDVLVKKGIAPL
ncbi:UNVERIFIED_CONTAM: Transcriptional adapter ADA2b [Sesamum radiatum]|uniref:Transcriptional adapter ADA2b n=1 Tax=Sesamum radiatum TaxID=300843 RepID=A0AAW2K4L4_SESRA